MDILTNIIKSEIKRQYKSVRNFSEIINIPYSTLANSLSKGVGLTSYDTVSKIMTALGINPVINQNKMSYYNERFYEINEMLSKLDLKGLHTVETVLNIEYKRCCPNDPKNITSNKSSYEERKEEIEKILSERRKQK